MLERWTGKLLVALDEPAADVEMQAARWALISGRRCVRQGECPATRLASLGGVELRASFFDRSAFFDRVVAQTANPRLAQVFARRHIDAQMLFNESYRLRLSIEPSGESDVTLKALVATELFCARAEDVLPLETRPVAIATLEEAAIAALVARVTVEPALVYFARGERFLAFVAEAGEVRQRRIEALGSGDKAALALAVERAETAFSGGGGLGGAEVSLRLLLGEARSLAQEQRYARDYASREVERKISAIVKGADAALEPELYGLAFVPRHWNLLEPSQAQAALAWKLALPASALLLGGGAVAGLLGATTAWQNESTDARLADHRAALERQSSTLKARIPEQKEIEQISELTKLMKQRADQVRIDYLLAWLTSSLPEGVTLQAFDVYPEGETPSAPAGGEQRERGEDILSKLFGKPRETAPKVRTAPPPKPEAGSYKARVELSLPGDYEHVEETAASIVRALSERAGFERAVLDFDAARPRAVLYASLTLKAREFQKP